MTNPISGPGLSPETGVAIAPKMRKRRGPLAPNPELWAALRHGPLLTEILRDFYTRVYADPRLAPFFRHTTKERAIEKQFSFLREILTGEEGYFGDKPYNAHHWMVISDELFNYREDLMEACLRDHGLAAPQVKRIRAIDEVFRKQIVKDRPKPRKLRGEELPLEGYGTIVMDIGTLCDDCQAPIDAGRTARYHVRTGQAYCAACGDRRLDEPAAV